MSTYEKFVRPCTRIQVRGLNGYLIKRDHIYKGDIFFLIKNRYHVYAVTNVVGKPWTLLEVPDSPDMYGVAVFTDAIPFPAHHKAKRLKNYYTLNNQYSWMESTELLNIDFLSPENLPEKDAL